MLKILIIEDEAPIRDEVMDWLMFEGYKPFGAENGRIGLELLHLHHPDFILCDIAMPEMNGHEVLAHVRSVPHLSQIPFVFLTAVTDEKSIQQAKKQGVNAYLTKPFTLAEVLGVIRTHFDG